MTFTVTQTPEQRFWQKVQRGEGCWPWLGTKRAGYGLFKVAGKHMQATRFAYQVVRGPIPDGCSLDHLCRNTACVNPAHLDPVSHKENVRRGISPSAKNAKKTHCLRGHPLEGDNLFIRRDGNRTCRVCNAVSKRRYKQKNK